MEAPPPSPPPLLLALARDNAAASLPVADVARLRALNEEDRLEMVNDGRGDPVGRLLEHYATLHAALDEAWSRAPQCTAVSRAEFDLWVGAATVVAGRAWAWHAQVRCLVRPQMTRALRDAFAVSWLGVMSSLLYVRVLEACRDDGEYDPWPLALLMRADENRYVRALASTPGRTNVVLSAEPVGRYSVRTWLYAFEALVETRSHTGWTPASADYFGALVLRYADLLLVRPNTGGGGGGGTAVVPTAEERRVYDHPLLCRSSSPVVPPAGTGAAASSAPLPLPPFLRPEFLFKCERRMFYAMRHNAAALSFFRARTPQRQSRSNAWRAEVLRALVAFVTSVATNTLLRTMVIDEVRSAFMGRHVLPGESEEVAFQQQLAPDRVPDADTVLYEMRRDTFMALQPLQKAAIRELVEHWASAMIKELEKDQQSTAAEAAAAEPDWDQVAAQRPAGERAAVMVVERCLDVWLHFASHRTFTFGGQSFVDDASREPPRDCPPMSPQAALAGCQGRAPVFVAVGQLYACVDLTEAEDALDIDTMQPHGQRLDVLVTPHFVDALARWLSVAVRIGRVSRSSIHDDLAILLDA